MLETPASEAWRWALKNMFQFDRPYKLYLILATKGSLWRWEEWSTFATRLDPIVKTCRQSPWLRSGQVQTGTRHWLKFGKLVWSSPSFQKWTHDSPQTKFDSANWEFFNTEVSTPSHQVAYKDGLPPDFFLAVLNEQFHKSIGDQILKQRIVLALAKDMTQASHDTLQQEVSVLADRYASALTASIERPWGKPFAGGFAHAVNDIAYTGLFKVGNYHVRPIDLETLTEQWTLL